MPEAVIEITGHADRRGEDASNLALSQRRLQAVEKRLRNLGVRSRGIQTSAFGESRPVSATDNFENNFFDRRVVVKVVSPDNGMLTRADD
jgi:outer membrane protein OmpA-like peptidoglycan-associated protein